MTSTWLEDYHSEPYDDSEDDYDSEVYDDSEDARSNARRRARARRIALARRRMSVARAGRVAGSAPSRPVTPTQAVSAIRNLDLEAKVTEESLRRALEQSNGRTRRNMYVTVLSTALDQVLDSFGGDLAKHDLVRAGARFAPMLLLAPEHRRKGLQGAALDPRVVGAVGVGAVVAAAEFRRRSAGVDQVVIATSKISIANPGGTLTAIVLDKNGAQLQQTATWQGLGADPLAVQPNGGFNVANATPGTWIDVLATAGGRTVVKSIEVTA